MRRFSRNDTKTVAGRHRISTLRPVCVLNQLTPPVDYPSMLLCLSPACVRSLLPLMCSVVAPERKCQWTHLAAAGHNIWFQLRSVTIGCRLAFEQKYTSTKYITSTEICHTCIQKFDYSFI